MKNIIILLTMMLTLTSFSQVSTDSIMATQVSETERIIDKYADKTINGFNKVVEKVTPMAEQGFEMAVKLQIAKGVAAILPVILFFLFLISMIIGHTKHDPGTDIMFIREVGTIVFFIISIFTFYSGITHLIAPEWHAIEEIIELFK